VAVNLIVAVVTMLVAGFVAVWIFVPRVRPWMEMPKHHFLERQTRFPGVIHDPDTESPP
jgi:hypothetical protein